MLTEDPEALDIMQKELTADSEIIEGILLEFDKDKYSEESIEEIKRKFHSIKGLLGFLGDNFEEIRQLVHITEDRLNEELSSRNKLKPDTIQDLLTFSDSMKSMASSLESDLSKTFIRELFGQLLETKEGIKLDEEYLLTLYFDGDSSMRSTRALASMNIIKRASTIKSTKPSREDMISGSSSFDKLEVDIISKLSEAELKEKFSRIPGIKTFELTRTDVKQDTKRAVEQRGIRIGHVDYSIKSEEMVKINYILEEMIRLDKFLQDHKFDQLERDEKSLISSFKRNLFEIQEILHSTRQLPLKVVLDPLPRLVRDVSRKENKEVEIYISGEDVRLDRNILEKLADPLVTLVQNSIYHGIETPEEREKIGKSRNGIVTIEVKEGMGETSVKVFDNGKGLDFERIWQKGVDLELVEGDYSETRAKELLFYPAFSTSDKVSTSGGRGFGLNQVSKLIREVNGKINITTTPGKNTTFELIFPVQNNLASTILVEINNQRFAFPETHVNRIIQTKDIDLDLSQKVTYYGDGERDYRIINLGRIVAEENRKGSEGAIILWNNGLAELGFYVDDIVTFEEMVINYNDPISEVNPTISGTSSMGGDIVFLLNPNAFVEV